MNLINKHDYYKEASRHEFCDSNFQKLINDIQKGKFGKDAIFIRYQTKEDYSAKDRKQQIEKLKGLKNDQDFKTGLKRDLKGDAFTILSNTKIDQKKKSKKTILLMKHIPQNPIQMMNSLIRQH